MIGAREYYNLFEETHQNGKLYFVLGSHARGDTFRVFVIPSGESAQRNGSSNAPTNWDAVEVYGIVAGLDGWTEQYGWLEKGPWQDDFREYVGILKEERDVERQKRIDREALDELKVEERKKALLSNY